MKNSNGFFISVLEKVKELPNEVYNENSISFSWYVETSDFCRNYIKNKCRYGNHCKYLHQEAIISEKCPNLDINKDYIIISNEEYEIYPYLENNS